MRVRINVSKLSEPCTRLQRNKPWPWKLRRMQEWPRLHNQVVARNFLGYATYYQKFIKYFAHIVEPLNKFLIKVR